ncbi:MAG TPA: SRPBCC family protein [Polyangiaceae bacterium]|nr:SRPBCC family protein [Polyangiaceae bacterium]
MRNVFGAQERRVENREYLGKPALVVVAARTYATSVEDLWEALTTPERLVRWFLPIEGELRVGGRYQLKGNAGGTITRCDPPSAFDVTWEFGGGTSWVSVRLTPEGKQARLTLEHIAHKEGIGEEHLKQFGPGAVGVGWDLSFEGLSRHVANPAVPLDAAEAQAWCLSSEGKAAIRASGEAWADAHAASGEEPAEATAKAERTIAFYTGG